MRLLTLDLATRTGWAKRFSDGLVDSGVQDFSLSAGELPGYIYVRFDRWLYGVFESFEPDAVTVEAAWGHMKSGAAAKIALGFYTRVLERCALAGFAPYEVNGSTLKKWTTGKGNAEKPEMISAVNERFGPPYITDDNEADAIALREYTLRELVAKEVA